MMMMIYQKGSCGTDGGSWEMQKLEEEVLQEKRG